MEANKKAITEQEWNPLNRNYVDGPKILTSILTAIKAQMDAMLTLLRDEQWQKKKHASAPYKTPLADIESLYLTDGVIHEKMTSLYT